jgi:hypothetical protein
MFETDSDQFLGDYVFQSILAKFYTNRERRHLRRVERYKLDRPFWPRRHR